MQDNVGAHNMISSFVPRGIPIGALPETGEPPLSLHSSIFSPQANSLMIPSWIRGPWQRSVADKNIPKMIFFEYHETAPPSQEWF